jgi:hypothetical protein
MGLFAAPARALSSGWCFHDVEGFATPRVDNRNTRTSRNPRQITWRRALKLAAFRRRGERREERKRDRPSRRALRRPNRRRRLVLAWLAPAVARTRQRLAQFRLQYRLDEAAHPSPCPRSRQTHHRKAKPRRPQPPPSCTRQIPRRGRLSEEPVAFRSDDRPPAARRE